MLGIGSEELLIIIIFSILVFDPDKLPEAGRRLGRAFRYLRKTKQEVHDVVQKEVIDPLESMDAGFGDEVRKIESSLKPGSFEQLFSGAHDLSEDSLKDASGRRSDSSGSLRSITEIDEGIQVSTQTPRVSDEVSQDVSVQKMADLLYGIDDGEEEAQGK